MKNFLKLIVVLPLLLGACSKLDSFDDNDSSIEEPVQHIEIEAASSYQTEKKTFYRDNKKIAGELYLPNNNKDVFPLLIMSHGFGGNMDGLKNDAYSFVKKGYATFVYDFIGGGSNIKSDGKMTEMSVLTEASDLNAVIDSLKEDERISNSHIFLLGQSQGGFVSTYVAGTRNDIRGLLDFYPAFCIKDDALEQYPNAEQVPETYFMSKMYTTLGKIYYTDVTSFDIYEVMANIQCETLLLHGTADNIVPVKYAQRAAQVIPHCTYIELQGAGHGFSGADNTKAINASLELMNNNL